MVSKFDGLNWLNNQSGVKAGIRSNEDYFSWARGATGYGAAKQDRIIWDSNK